MSIWGRRQDHKPTEPSGTQNGDEHRHAPEETFEEPTERSRLLPADSHEGFLSPDDPAVSPTNKATPNNTLEAKIIANTRTRYRPTIYGACARCTVRQLSHWQ